HVPKRKSKNIVLVYAVEVLHDGKKMVEVMVKDEVDDIMKMSESWKAYDKGKTPSCIWVDHYSEMARKTVLKRLVKYLPKTDKWDHLATAISISDGDFKISEAQEDYIHSLIRTSTFDDDRKRDMERSLISMTSEEAGVLITKLQMNQIDNISAGMNYNMGDIHNKLDEHTK
ncbi:MAG: recombinase RecT, partial [Bacteroidetes bacterium]|nr:recombinase RecT [Bacteroidota bacterium]